MKLPDTTIDTEINSHSWHSYSVQQVLDELVSRKDGLDTKTAVERLKRFGVNSLPQASRRNAFMRFLLQFNNPLIYILLVAGVVMMFVGHSVDSAVILSVVVINAAIGFIQEGKAESALDAIRQLLAPKAIVMRDCLRKTIPVEEIVPGDIVHLSAGDKVPADIRLVHTHNLRIDEAVLTGESAPVDKFVTKISGDVPISERACMVFSSTLVSNGQATGVVVGTGTNTEIGRISKLLSETTDLATPLIRQMAEFGRWLSLVIIIIAGLVFVIGIWFRDYSPVEMLTAAIGLAIAGIPEGLPAVMTITLAIGVQRMARQNAIVRKLPAVETLGSVTVICTDKTGTLTKNEMTVTKVITASHTADVSGAGYKPHGDFKLKEQLLVIDEFPDLLELMQGGLLCNDASLQKIGGEWQLSGDPTEGALITLALKAGMKRENLEQTLPRTNVIPFESQLRFMATGHTTDEGHHIVYLKGAPEKVLAMCRKQRGLIGDEALAKDYWKGQIEVNAARGLRMLAIAKRSSSSGSLDHIDKSDDFVMLGLVGMIDPPRPEAIAAVRHCRSAGIQIKMITGDHAITAVSIGRQMGFEGGALTGMDLAHMDDVALSHAAHEFHIFARTDPEHKLRLVKALQDRGEIVAMTGDGVNDAPALRRADIGIAMGLKGTEVAKDAAEIVLADDNFASIASAVEKGRTIYDNIKKAILFTLPTNGGEAGIIIIAVLVGMTLPITAVQILWINMVTEITLGLALAFEPAEHDIMRRRPRDSHAALLSGALIWRIGLVSAIMIIGGMGLYFWEMNSGSDLAKARTVAVNTLVIAHVFYLFNCRVISGSALTWSALRGTRYVWISVSALVILQLLFTHMPLMHHLFGSAHLDAGAWLRCILVGAALFLIVEGDKLMQRSFKARS